MYFEKPPLPYIYIYIYVRTLLRGNDPVEEKGLRVRVSGGEWRVKKDSINIRAAYTFEQAGEAGCRG